MSRADDAPLGLIYTFSAFLLWGLAPVFFKLVAHVSAFEVLVHRIVWSVLILAAVILMRQQWRLLFSLPRETLSRLFVSSLFVSANWLIFIWAVAQSRVLETSLGYFINPLISVLFGLLFLGERLRTGQKLAIALAMLGVINQIVQVGYLPWVALALALTFASYGLLRKTIKVDPVLGLFVETVLLLPFALAYLAYLAYNGEMVFGGQGLKLDVILICSGFMTTVPLLFFAAGAQRLSLTVVGMIQYITPTITFFLAIFLYYEPFDLGQLVSFVLIWSGLVVFTGESLRARPARS